MGIYVVWFKKKDGDKRFTLVEAHRRRLVDRWAKMIAGILDHEIVDIQKAVVTKLRGS